MQILLVSVGTELVLLFIMFVVQAYTGSRAHTPAHAGVSADHFSYQRSLRIQRCSVCLRPESLRPRFVDFNTHARFTNTVLIVLS